VSTGIAFRQQQFAQRSSLLVASDSRRQTTTARYNCNRVANTITLNPPHLLKKIVLTILMCRRFRENQSERRITAEIFWITSKLSVSRAALPW
jgi:hypothetical protein